MNIINSKESEDFQNLFTKTEYVNEGKIDSKNITPSKLYCQVYEALKLLGTPKMGENQSFESIGYKESGKSRHQAIQKFLMENPEVVWYDPAKYIEENNLPFEVKPNQEVLWLLDKYPTMELKEAQDLLGDYEVNLHHKTQPLSFQLDGLIKYRGEFYIIEIKTIGKKDFTQIPLDKHQWQGKSYSFLLKIPKVIWIYECRDDFKIKTAIQLFREGDWAEVRNRLNTIIINKDSPINLERNFSKCKYCLYRNTCTTIFASKTDDRPF